MPPIIFSQFYDEYDTQNTIKATITFTMNDIEFTPNTFAEVLEQVLDGPMSKVCFMRSIKTQTTVTRTLKPNDDGSTSTSTSTYNDSDSAKFTLEKDLLRLLYNNNKTENISAFKSNILQLLNKILLKTTDLNEKNNDIKIIMQATLKTPLANKPGEDIDPEIASDFYSKYLSTMIMHAFKMSKAFDGAMQKQDPEDKYEGECSFPIDFESGMPEHLKYRSKVSSPSFKKSRLEDLLFSIISNAPKIRSAADDFPLFKSFPSLKDAAIETVDEAEALAKEYIAILNVDLVAVAERNKNVVIEEALIRMRLQSA